MQTVLIILTYVLMIASLVISVLWSDRKHLTKALDAEVKRNAELFAQYIAESKAHSATIRGTTARLYSMTGHVPEIVRNLNSKEH